MLKSNNGFSNRAGMLRDEAMAAALIGRLLHLCRSVNSHRNGFACTISYRVRGPATTR